MPDAAHGDDVELTPELAGPGAVRTTGRANPFGKEMYVAPVGQVIRRLR
jgi:hypothetical protein